MGRNMHLWSFGEMGQPLVVFPSNAGVAHEWEKGGMIDAIAPLLRDRRLKVYCPETNVSRTFSGEGTLHDRMARHRQYERFLTDTLIPFIRHDTRSPTVRVLVTGCSMGALYSSLFALKFPELVKGALCLSGRYRGAGFGRGEYNDDLYFNDPLAFVPNLSGFELDRVRRHTHLTLVVGTGAHEDGCIPETLEMAAALRGRAIPHHLAVWGKDSRHDYSWWKKQALHYLRQLA